MAPSPERYREIQEALASRGYLQPEEVTGNWNQNSIDALRRFQTEQNIESTGKINSLSLIALGLGPKREPAPGVAAPPVEPPASARQPY
jgi:Putative peptidoglycan binding domain